MNHICISEKSTYAIKQEVASSLNSVTPQKRHFLTLIFQNEKLKQFLQTMNRYILYSEKTFVKVASEEAIFFHSKRKARQRALLYT